jgi:transposase-like protein
MNSVFGERRRVNGDELLSEALAAGYAALCQAVASRLNQLLVLAVSHLLGRAFHQRRGTLPGWEEQAGRCARCGGQAVARMSRNGYRKRSLLTPLGWIDFELPRVRCVCGGSVGLELDGLVRPYQRLSDAVDEQIQRWYGLGLSLRQLEAELTHSFLGALGRRTLLRRLHQVSGAAGRPRPSAVPPVLQVDAIWVTQLRPTGAVGRDRKGRRRAKKGRFKRPLLLALGVWPEQDYCELLAWQLADSEDTAQWSAFLSQLEALGIRGENGLELIIHDGGSGLCGALATVHFGARQQRCLFHKLRNIARAIRLPEGLSRQERRRQRRAILKQFQAIWQAKQLATVLRRYLQVVRTFRQSQPEAVATLRRDFRETVTYFQVLARFPHWEVRHLRTTSRLERVNRRLRRRLRAVGAFHSDAGLLAMCAHEIALFNA